MSGKLNREKDFKKKISKQLPPYVLYFILFKIYPYKNVIKTYTVLMFKSNLQKDKTFA